MPVAAVFANEGGTSRPGANQVATFRGEMRMNTTGPTLAPSKPLAEVRAEIS
jgi:hypothetical protein